MNTTYSCAALEFWSMFWCLCWVILLEVFLLGFGGLFWFCWCWVFVFEMALQLLGIAKKHLKKIICS